MIDTGPDFREQMLRAGVRRVDAVLYTHPHADHIHGIDDLRGYVLEQSKLMDVYCDRPTLTRLMDSFGYCFETPLGSSYPPILKADNRPRQAGRRRRRGGRPLLRAAAADPWRHHPLGFRIGGLAYCPDVSDFPPPTVERLQGLDVLVIDAAIQAASSHLSLGQALGWIDSWRRRRH